MKKTTIALALGVMLLATAAVSNAQRSAGEAVDDTTIALSVKKALADSDDVSAADVNVEVHKRTVQLSGFVPTEGAKAAAVNIAGGIEGVVDVHDAMVVMGGKRSLGRTIDDETIYAKVKLKIAQVSGYGDAIGVVNHVRNGEVLLSGFVDSEDVRANIVSAAGAVDGVTKVYDRFSLK